MKANDVNDPSVEMSFGIEWHEKTHIPHQHEKHSQCIGECKKHLPIFYWYWLTSNN